jgi:hypothetical protein
LALLRVQAVLVVVQAAETQLQELQILVEVAEVKQRVQLVVVVLEVQVLSLLAHHKQRHLQLDHLQSLQAAVELSTRLQPLEQSPSKDKA